MSISHRTRSGSRQALFEIFISTVEGVLLVSRLKHFAFTRLSSLCLSFWFLHAKKTWNVFVLASTEIFRAARSTAASRLSRKSALRVYYLLADTQATAEERQPDLRVARSISAHTNTRERGWETTAVAPLN